MRMRSRASDKSRRSTVRPRVTLTAPNYRGWPASQQDRVDRFERFQEKSSPLSFRHMSRAWCIADHIRLGQARAIEKQGTAARGGKPRLSRSGKNLPHGALEENLAPRRGAELHAQGMGMRQIAVELGSWYGSVQRELAENSKPK